MIAVCVGRRARSTGHASADGHQRRRTERSRGLNARRPERLRGSRLVPGSIVETSITVFDFTSSGAQREPPTEEEIRPRAPPPSRLHWSAPGSAAPRRTASPIREHRHRRLTDAADQRQGSSWNRCERRIRAGASELDRLRGERRGIEEVHLRDAVSPRSRPVPRVLRTARSRRADESTSGKPVPLRVEAHDSARAAAATRPPQARPPLRSAGLRFAIGVCAVGGSVGVVIEPVLAGLDRRRRNVRFSGIAGKHQLESTSFAAREFCLTSGHALHHAPELRRGNHLDARALRRARVRRRG